MGHWASGIGQKSGQRSAVSGQQSAKGIEQQSNRAAELFWASGIGLLKVFSFGTRGRWDLRGKFDF
ncbi:MAG: hypothetical protein F6J93_37355 [Oscillatoria sp. SIO1A7]|nr:hypothetical protein [Oscillatoria sp. SIO1A7]